MYKYKKKKYGVIPFFFDTHFFDSSLISLIRHSFLCKFLCKCIYRIQHVYTISRRHTVYNTYILLAVGIPYTTRI